MNKHSLYKWFRRMAMLSGIPALALFFTTCCKYGAPKDRILGWVHEKGTGESIPEVLIQDENGDSITTTDQYGCFQLTTHHCVDLTLIKEGYQSKDTILCPVTGAGIVDIAMQKLPEE